MVGFAKTRVTSIHTDILSAGKYVGNRPIRLMKVQAQYGGTNKVTVGTRKAKELDKIAKNKGKPLNGRPTPW
jgi:hypothetical protein